MGDEKKRARDDAVPFSRKKSKVMNSSSVREDSRVERSNNDYSDHHAAEILSYENIREGMLLLGCVTQIKQKSFVMSLPGSLFGIVMSTNISDIFSNAYREYEAGRDPMPLINLVVQVGMVFPCKVIDIIRNTSKRPDVILSINPTVVNSELKPASLYSKMVLFVELISKEDHGYVVNVGADCIQGFIPTQASEHGNEELRLGTVVPTLIKQIHFSEDKTSAKTQLSILDFNELFPEISVEDIKLSSIFPGARLRADVVDVKPPFIYLKYLCFDACASILAIGSTYRGISIGSEIIGTVLYVHPVTHLIYIMLNMKPTPAIFDNYFGLRRYEHVHNLKYEYLYKSCAYYKINNGTYGFIHVNEFPQRKVNHTVSKAGVLCLHYIDNLVQLSLRPSMIEKVSISKDDIQVGNIYEAEVKFHVKHQGMFVELCPGLSGFIRIAFMTDFVMSNPETMYPVGRKVKCRVTSICEEDDIFKVHLTTKHSLLELQNEFIPLSYETMEKGQYYKGVIVKTAKEYVLVAFFYNITGIVSMSHIPEGSIYFIGQTVLCKVLSCSAKNKKLKLSIKPDNWLGEEQSKTKISEERRKSLEQELLSLPPDKYGTEEFADAKVTSVKGSQLNIVFNGTKGRVHITELGCTDEDVYPLRNFRVGDKIPVVVIGDRINEKKNFSKITHKDNLKSFKECSMQYPPSSSITDLKPGSSLLGFVKKITDVSVILWLTYTEVGVLDYLHFSENLKDIRKVQQNLKIGHSLEVYVLNNQDLPEKHGGKCITLTRIEENLPEVGKNVVGLVHMACTVEGLVMKLPFGYYGCVSVTDLTDAYVPVQTILDRCHKCKFLLCHVLEVNHVTYYCKLSLRKSRVYGQKTSVSPNFCPEITRESLKEGVNVHGFVKSITNSAITVTLGRNLEGKIEVHSCNSADCSLCDASRDITAKHPVGSVVEVCIQKKGENSSSPTLVLKDSETVINGNDENDRLAILEEIPSEED